jgi:hypothetical protein
MPDEAAPADQQNVVHKDAVDAEADTVVNKEAVAPADTTASSSIE